MNTMKDRVERTLHQLILQEQKIVDQMDIYDRWGSGPYYKHKLEMIKREIIDLKYILGTDEDEVRQPDYDHLITQIREQTNHKYQFDPAYKRGVSDAIRVIMEVDNSEHTIQG